MIPVVRSQRKRRTSFCWLSAAYWCSLC